MTEHLSAEEQLKFSNIMFQSEGREHQQIQNLKPEQKSKLKSLYAQKIAYDTANAGMRPNPTESQYNSTKAPGILSVVCCCFNPEQNRDKFDITSAVFLKRIFGTLLFFKGDFLTIDEGKTQLYGFLWLSITYVIILGLAANMNEYFILPQNYRFNNDLLLKALGICAVFLISQPFIYAGVVKSLSGYISSLESMMLTGYSIVLYFIPTILCLIPSLYWHVGMLAAAGLIRCIFLWRNYSSKIPSTAKTVGILVTVLIIEALFVAVIMRVLFANDSGYNFSDGSSRVFNNPTHLQALRQFIS